MKIETLILQSHSLTQQLSFYVEKLGFKLIEKSENSFSIEVGKSVLVFKKAASKKYYHFAFNIPPFQIMEALDWAKQRVEILKYENAEIVDFKSWNAKAFYFFDADGNIVELIDRRNLERKPKGKFSNESIFEISEMGLPVKNIRKAFEQLNEQANIQKFSGDLDYFCAAGDEHGLFIIVNENIKKWLPTELPAKSFPFELEFSNNQERYFLKCDAKEFFIENANYQS